SPLESCARVVFDAFRLPPPELQAEVTGGRQINPDGAVVADEYHEYHGYKVDFIWRGYMTVAETDGLLKYDSGQRAIDERKRDRLIREAGYKLVHITWAELFKYPERVIQRILDAFAATSAYSLLRSGAGPGLGGPRRAEARVTPASGFRYVALP